MNDQSNCPPKQTLIDFLLGKLEPGQVANCERHLNDCKPCGDTIRGLDANDTFVGLASNSNPSRTDTDSNEESDQLVVKMLIDKMQEMQPTLGSSGKQAATSPSRADEIVNLLQPTVGSDSMGRLAHYEIHELLGNGATSVVFRARDEQLHRDVALKVLRPSLGDGARERFLAEARAAAALNNENITTIYQVAAEGHLAYMAQQWLPGETLEARLEREPELDIDEIKSFSLQVANGLAAAHAKNLIHRDIKPANIWIDSERNRAIILDFGLVRVADDQPQLTETGMIAGTPNYMSPEQTRGSEVDSRSDLFSLGCVMYRMCTGRLPFQAGNTLATLQAIQNDTTPPPRHLNTRIPSELSELVMMLLCKDVEGRPRTADQVATALQDATVMTELLADRRQSQVSADRQKSPPRRRWWLWGAAATVLIALLLLSGPQIVRVVTNHGVLEIESNDPDVAVEVLQGGEVVYVIDRRTDQRLEIEAGTYRIQPRGHSNSFDLSQDTLTMKRGGKVVVTVTKLATGETALAIPNLDGLQQQLKKPEEQTPDLIQKAKKRYEQIVNRIKQVEIERETAEATLDWASAISATESLVEIHKALVSEAIELRELGEMTPEEVDAVKQNLLREDSILAKLRQSRHSRVPVIELEQLYAIALEKFDQLEMQFKEGALEGPDFWPSQLALFEAEANLHEARKHYDQALRSLGRIVETRKSMLDSVVIRRDAGVPSEIGFVEAKIGFENAKARFRDFSRKHNLPGDLDYYLKSGQSTPSNDTEIEYANASGKLTYDGKTIDEWLSILETERSPERLKTALDAIKQLGQESDGQKVVDAIMQLASVHGQQGVFFDLNDKAVGIFNNVPKEIVVNALLSELKVPNQNMGNFLAPFPFWYRVWEPGKNVSPDPEFAALLADRSELLQNLLFKIIDTELDPELASEGREHLEWSVRLLVNLLTEFEFFKPNDQEALIERISNAIPLIQAVDNKVWLVEYLAKAGVDTSGYEDMLLEVLIPKDPQAGWVHLFLSPYSFRIFETLKEMGPEHTSQKTIDAITKILSDDKYWQGSGFAAPQPNKSKILAIELVGSYGEKAVSALPVLKKIANKDDPYKEAATQAIIQIEVPKHALDDALNLQGRWKSMNAMVGDAENVGPFMVVVEGLSLARFGGPFRVEASGPERDKLRLGIRTKTFGFTDKAGELDLVSSSSRVRGIYELSGDVWKLCLAKTVESSRPTSFKDSELQDLILFERVK